MTTVHVIPELDRKGLRDFGLSTGGIVAALFGIFFPWLLERPWPLWPWIVLGLLGGCSATEVKRHARTLLGRQMP